MKQSLFLIAFTCISFSTAFAQSANPGFLFDKFEKGRVIYKTGGQVSEGNFNYDTVNEKALFVLQDTVIFELDRTDIVSELWILDRVFEHAGSGIFYEKVKAGNHFFYVRWKSKPIYKEKEGGYGTRPTTGAIDQVNQINSMGGLYKLKIDNNYRIVPENLYYLKNEKGFKRFGSFDTLAKQFKNCRSQVKSYIKSENLDFRILDDVAKAVTFGVMCE